MMGPEFEALIEAPSVKNSVVVPTGTNPPVMELAPPSCRCNDAPMTNTGDQERVHRLRELLGSDVLLLSWPLGSKGGPRRWGHLTVTNMTSEYLEGVATGNIGVALGQKSGGLCAIDLDRDDLVQNFLTANPGFKATLQTRGARGRVFWFRCKGVYPQKTKVLKTHAGEHAGEFRTTGAQSIIAGIHPDTGKPYEIVHEAPPITVEFNSIIWPIRLAPPPASPVGSQECTEDTEATEATEATDVVGGGQEWFSPVMAIEEALRISLPTRVHENNDRLFTLARAVKTLELTQARFSPQQLKDVFNQWYERAQSFLRAEQSQEDYWIEFLNAYGRAKFPLGGATIARAWKLAQTCPPPPEALQFENPDLRLLVALCRQLQISAGEEPFFLSSRVCQKLFKHPCHTTAAKWLRSLVVLQVLQEVEKGAGHRASRYRFLPPLFQAAPAQGHFNPNNPSPAGQQAIGNNGQTRQTVREKE